MQSVSSAVSMPEASRTIDGSVIQVIAGGASAAGMPPLQVPGSPAGSAAPCPHMAGKQGVADASAGARSQRKPSKRHRTSQRGPKVLGKGTPPTGTHGKGAGQKVSGKSSWYGGPNDSQDNNKPASGIPNTVPGIAIMNRETLGGWWRVKLWNGQEYDIQQTDLGPAAWTGKKIDFNYSAVKAMGFTEKNFPTGKVASAQYLGKS